MKIKVLPTGDAPEYYTFNGEVVTAHKDGLSEDFDLSVIQTGDQFTGIEADTLNLNGSHILRNVYRDQLGELHISICQKVGAGHWEAKDEFDVNQYEPSNINVIYREDKPHAGVAVVQTSQGMVGVK